MDQVVAQALTLFDKLGRGEANRPRAARAVDAAPSPAGSASATTRRLVSRTATATRDRSSSRASWTSLNGPGSSRSTPTRAGRRPTRSAWDRTIVVPFSPETAASGIGDTGFYKACWYRRTFERAARSTPGERLLLHFGAVDYAAKVWVNGAARGRPRGRLHAVLRRHHRLPRRGGAAEPSSCAPRTTRADLAKPRGKQDWQLEPHSIWYPRTTGIWQTVWLERVPATLHRVAALDAERRALGASASRRCVDGAAATTCGCACGCTSATSTARRRHATRSSPARCTAASRSPIPASTTTATSCSGARRTPTLIDAELQLVDGRRRAWSTRSRATPRCARSRAGRRFVLNGRPLPAAHGARPGLLAGDRPDARPTTRRCRRDVELHEGDGLQRRAQAPEDRETRATSTGPTRSGCWSGRRCRAPTASRRDSIERLTREWTEVIERDVSHPCIVAWVPFNESWGVPEPARQPGRSGTTCRRSTT